MSTRKAAPASPRTVRTAQPAASVVVSAPADQGTLDTSSALDGLRSAATPAAFRAAMADDSARATYLAMMGSTRRELDRVSGQIGAYASLAGAYLRMAADGMGVSAGELATAQGVSSAVPAHWLRYAKLVQLGFTGWEADWSTLCSEVKGKPAFWADVKGRTVLADDAPESEREASRHAVRDALASILTPKPGAITVGGSSEPESESGTDTRREPQLASEKDAKSDETMVRVGRNNSVSLDSISQILALVETRPISEAEYGRLAELADRIAALLGTADGLDGAE